MSRPRASLIVVLLLALSSGVAALDLEPGRVSYVLGEALVLGPEEEEWGYLEPNLAVLPGDSYRVSEDSLLELELPRDVLLKGDSISRFDVTSIHPVPAVRHRLGSLFLCTGEGNRLAVRVETPAATVRIEGWSAVRIDAEESGLTRITVRRGRAEVEAEGETARLAVDRRLYVEPGLLPSATVYADPVLRDIFEDWAIEGCGEKVERELQLVGYRALGGYGSWTSYEGNRIWVPSVPATWSPYHSGSWNWYGSLGWTWVGHEPWAWVTHHYGNWTWAVGIGWGWIPGTSWRGGHVAWWRTGGHLVWAPLDPWGRPCTVPDRGGPYHVWVGGHRLCRRCAHATPIADLARGRLHPRPLPPEDTTREAVRVVDVRSVRTPELKRPPLRRPLSPPATEVVRRHGVASSPSSEGSRYRPAPVARDRDEGFELRARSVNAPGGAAGGGFTMSREPVEVQPARRPSGITITQTGDRIRLREASRANRPEVTAGATNPSRTAPRPRLEGRDRSNRGFTAAPAPRPVPAPRAAPRPTVDAPRSPAPQESRRGFAVAPAPRPRPAASIAPRPVVQPPRSAGRERFTRGVVTAPSPYPPTRLRPSTRDARRRAPIRKLAPATPPAPAPRDVQPTPPKPAPKASPSQGFSKAPRKRDDSDR